MDEKELTWEDAKADLGKNYTLVREVKASDGTVMGKYPLTYHEIVGDKYEQIVLDARMRSRGDQDKFVIEYQRGMRLGLLETVMGKPYTAMMDREMKPWLMNDLNAFIQEYSEGNL